MPSKLKSDLPAGRVVFLPALLAPLEQDKQIKMLGGLYDSESGVVNFF